MFLNCILMIYSLTLIASPRSLLFRNFKFYYFYVYMGASKSSETNPLPEYGFIMSDPIMILSF